MKYISLSKHVRSPIENSLKEAKSIKLAERGKIDNPNTQIRDSSLSCIGKGTAIKSGRAKKKEKEKKKRSKFDNSNTDTCHLTFLTSDMHVLQISFLAWLN